MFYGKKGIEDAEVTKQEAFTAEGPADSTANVGIDAETLAKLVSSPELASLLKILAKNI